MSLRIPEMCSSSSSLDLTQVFSRVESRTVLSESITLETLPTVCSDDVPPFPSGHSPPLATVVSMWSRLSMFPLTLRKSRQFNNRPSTVYVTTPTAPRIKTMLDERICVKRWSQNISGVPAPGHVPWGEPEDVSPTRWVPEGSSYSPETFRGALRKKRSSRYKKSQKKVPSDYSKGSPTATHHSTRDDLVFEREITLNTDGQSKRWSLQVPAASMNPEMVDLMLELRDLGSFFSGELLGVNELVKLPEKAKNTLIPPTLIVSNSEISVPILLDSISDSPLPLAARRGKKVPAPLSLKREVEIDAYPGMPTAFLGSPSAYSPRFEFANSKSSESMEFQDMINSLRSYCAAIEKSYTCDDDDELVSTKTDASSAGAQTVQETDDEEDEWAFAAELMKTYGDQMDFDVNPLPQSEDSGFRSRSLPSESMLHNNSSTDIGSDSAADASGESPDTSLGSIAVCQNQVDKPTLEFPQRTVSPASSPPYLSNPRPALTNPLSPKSAQGFLKRCKSVRFASLPSRHGSPPDPAKHPATMPRRSIGTLTTTTTIRRPSPLRQSLSPENDTFRLRNTPVISPPFRAANADSPAVGRKPVADQMLNTRPLLTHSTNAHASKHSGTNSFPFRRSTPRACTAPTDKSSLGRHSLSKLMGTSPKKGKENKVGPMSHQPKPGWSTLDENALRREGDKADVRTRSGSKSRMPVPLRNILTRFK